MATGRQCAQTLDELDRWQAEPAVAAQEGQPSPAQLRNTAAYSPVQSISESLLAAKALAASCVTTHKSNSTSQRAALDDSKDLGAVKTSKYLDVAKTLDDSKDLGAHPEAPHGGGQGGEEEEEEEEAGTDVANLVAGIGDGLHRASLVVDGLDDLAKLLNLTRVPRRIEGYDISHIQGFGAVAAISVLIDGQPAPHLYRWCRIASVRVRPGHSDDYASLAETIARRFPAAAPLTLRHTS